MILDVAVVVWKLEWVKNTKNTTEILTKEWTFDGVANT